MKTYSILCLCAALLAAAAPLRAQTPVRVTAHNVNLRAMPRLENSEVLGQAQYDERLTAWEIGEEWISITPPPSTDFWISKAYVQQPQNTIGATRVNVRAGPSINYNVVDTLELGAVVEPREEISDWLKIAPPPTARVWIHRDFVDILSGDPEPAQPADETAEAPAEPARKEKTARQRKAKAEPAATAAPAPAPAATAAQTAEWPTPIVSPSVPVRETAAGVIPVPPPSDLKLIPLEGQGRMAEFVGELRAAPLINEAPTRYRVIRWQNNRWQVLCHVYGAASKFRGLQDKRVRVKGREYWIQGAAAPVLVPDQIQEAPAPD